MIKDPGFLDQGIEFSSDSSKILIKVWTQELPINKTYVV